MIISDKTPIKDHSVFDGLYVPEKCTWAKLFMNERFKLVKMHVNNADCFVIFEVIKDTFVFHLVNFTQANTNAMTETFFKAFVRPFCAFRGLDKVRASVERRGMARKLERQGLRHIGNNIYEGEI